ncbi:threonine/serine ThrE exporter family protein [Gordonia sp. NPDC003424]
MTGTDGIQPGPEKPSGETGLEPLQLIARSDAVTRMGALMLGSGAGSYRVKEAMGRVGRALGIDEIDSQVNLTEIVTTTKKGRIFRTQIIEVPVLGVNSDRIAALESISRTAEPGLTVQNLHAQLDEVEHRRPRYNKALVALAAAVACGAFAFLNNGTWQECLAAGVAAGVGKFVQTVLGRARINQLAVVCVSAAVACLCFVLGSLLLGVIVHSPNLLQSSAFTSAVLFLVPGFALMTAALDIARFDFNAGISRLVYASTIILSAAIGAWAIATVSGLTPETEPAAPLPAASLIGLRILASFIGVLGFAVTFNTPLRIALCAASFGAVANPIRLALVDADLAAQVAAALATLIVGLFAAFFAERIQAPRITLSVPSMLIMVPGAAAYRALVYFNNEQIVQAVGNAVQAMIVVIGLAVGLAAARILTDKEWSLEKPSWTSLPGGRRH